LHRVTVTRRIRTKPEVVPCTGGWYARGRRVELGVMNTNTVASLCLESERPKTTQPNPRKTILGQTSFSAFLTHWYRLIRELCRLIIRVEIAFFLFFSSTTRRSETNKCATPALALALFYTRSPPDSRLEKWTLSSCECPYEIYTCFTSLHRSRHDLPRRDRVSGSRAVLFLGFRFIPSAPSLTSPPPLSQTQCHRHESHRTHRLPWSGHPGSG
jgi:hypothetical protein